MNTITATIFEQLGANKFVAMTGAKEFCSGSNMLQFRLPKLGKNKSNLIQITLMTSDTYMIQFYNYRNLSVKMVSQFVGVYADQLQSVFTEQTGLYTSL